MPNEIDFPKIFKSFILNQHYVSLKLDIDFKKPPKEPIMFQLSKLFKNSNSNGCAVSDYKIYKVLNLVDGSKIISKDYESIFDLNHKTGLFVIYSFIK